MLKWINTKIKDLTIEDAISAYQCGICFTCGDGKLRHVSSKTHTDIINILRGED